MKSVDVWVIDQRLGQGGIGTVYRCHNRHAPRIQAAVKLLSPSLAASADIRRRFVREAELLFRLDHPHIVKVRNIRMDHEPPFIEMAFVEGQTIAAVLSRGPLDAAQVCALGAPLLRAVRYLHAQGVHHRDIKPDNIIVRGLTPTLVDFGLAAEDHSATLARPGAVMGTVGYVPPEWGSREPPRGEDWDRYSLGVILWECLRGEPAFPLDPDRALLEQLLDVRNRKMALEALDPGEGVPEVLREVVRCLTAKDPTLRDLDLDASAAALDALRARLKQQGLVAAAVADVPEGVDELTGQRTLFADSFDEAEGDGSSVSGGAPPTRAEREDEEVSRASTLPDLPAAIAPTLPDTQAAAGDPGGSWLGKGLGLLAATAVLGGLAAYVLWPEAPSTSGGTLQSRLVLSLSPADPGLPYTVFVDGAPVAADEKPLLRPGPHTLRVLIGEACEGTPTPAHCAVVEKRLQVREDGPPNVTQTLTLPAAEPRAVVLGFPTTTAERVRVNGGVWAPPKDPATLSLLPGQYTLTAQAGTCPDDPCADRCPDTCSEASVTVQVPFEGPASQDVSVDLPAPAPPPVAAAAAPAQPPSGPVTVQAFAGWLRRNPTYQPGGAKAVALADSKYLRGWTGAEPGSFAGQPAPQPGEPVSRVSALVAEAYCRGRGGLAGLDVPVGSGPGDAIEIRSTPGGGYATLDVRGSDTPLQGKQVQPLVGFRCKRR